MTCDRSVKWEAFDEIIQNTSITEVSCFCHAHVDFHPFQHLLHMALVLMAKMLMTMLKGFWSHCNVNFCSLSWDHNAHVHAVCVCYPPACCHKRTIVLRNITHWCFMTLIPCLNHSTPRIGVFQYWGCTTRLPGSQGTTCPLPPSWY